VGILKVMMMIMTMLDSLSRMRNLKEAMLDSLSRMRNLKEAMLVVMIFLQVRIFKVPMRIMKIFLQVRIFLTSKEDDE
jgi:hypothetical protein